MMLVVTGSSGFLGMNLLKHLLKEADYSIIAYTTHPDKLEGALEDDKKRISIVTDIKDIKWSEVDILLNLAFPRNTDGVQIANGLKFIADIFFEAKEGGVGSVINVSSQSVYSQKREAAATEETELNLESTYAVGKYATELMCNTICHDIPHINLRMSSLIGAGFDQRITNKLVKKVLCGEPIKIVGGNQRFGFLDVRDAVTGIEAVIKSNPANWQEEYNLGTNESYTLEEIAKCVCEVNEAYGGRTVEYKIEHTESYQSSHLNCELFMKQFGWEAKYELVSTLEDIYESINNVEQT